MDNLIAWIHDYQNHLYELAVGLSAVFWLFYIYRYMSSQTERTGWTKLGDIITMFFYIGLFILYIVAGIGYTNNAAIGTVIGIVGFTVMFEILAWFKKKREEKRARAKYPSPQ